jgi:hypothetical protein
MSTTLAAALLALAGVVAVAGVSWVFYLVGRAEDRDREAARKAAGPPPPQEEEHPDHDGHVARERRRPMPPRRPQS